MTIYEVNPTNIKQYVYDIKTYLECINPILVLERLFSDVRIVGDNKDIYIFHGPYNGTYYYVSYIKKTKDIYLKYDNQLNKVNIVNIVRRILPTVSAFDFIKMQTKIDIMDYVTEYIDHNDYHHLITPNYLFI